MSHDHETLIESMAEAFWNAGGRSRPWSALTDTDRAIIKDRLLAALRAGKRQGYALAKLPPEANAADNSDFGQGHVAGWDSCLSEIDTVDPGEVGLA